MDLQLKGKTAVVTGGSRGIGRGIAMALATEGCHVAIVARGVEDLEDTATAVRLKGIQALPIPLDITQPESGLQIVDRTMAAFGRIDILVNNAGGNRKGSFELLTDEDWDAILGINLLSHVRISRASIPHMKERGGGVILFISSIFGRESWGPQYALYNTSKSGIISLAKIMAAELAPFNIRVNSIAPGSIRFPGGSWDRRCKEDPTGMAEFVKRNLPFGRFGTVEEIADVTVFLSSERASLISGACINVDGCQSHSLI
jgi:3-oxoacyl-[acyl-carrier protein] reductase